MYSSTASALQKRGTEKPRCIMANPHHGCVRQKRSTGKYASDTIVFYVKDALTSLKEDRARELSLAYLGLLDRGTLLIDLNGSGAQCSNFSVKL